MRRLTWVTRRRLVSKIQKASSARSLIRTVHAPVNSPGPAPCLPTRWRIRPQFASRTTITSDAFRDLVALAESTDEEVVTEEAGSQLVYDFGPNERYFVSRLPGVRAVLLALAEEHMAKTIPLFIREQVMPFVLAPREAPPSCH